MPPTTMRATVLAAATLIGLLAGCTAGPPAPAPPAPVVQLGPPGGTNTVLPPGTTPQPGPPHTAADVEFVHGMIPHHEQALAMTALIAERTTDAALATMAQRIEVSQRDEIGQLTGWLAARGEQAGGHGGHGGMAGHLMPGMLTDAEMAQLAGARDAAFDTLFLQYMIRHHEGAIAMTEALLTGGEGGQETEVALLAQHIASDQAIEVARMKAMLGAP